MSPARGSLWVAGGCPAPVRPLKPVPAAQPSVSGPLGHHRLPPAVKTRTGRGPNDRAAAGDSVSDSAWPQLSPHFLQRCRLRLQGRKGSR